MFCKNCIVERERWPRSSYMYRYMTWVFIMNVHTSRFIGIYRNVSVGVSVNWNSKSEAAIYSCHINQSFERTDNSQTSRDFYFQRESRNSLSHTSRESSAAYHGIIARRERERERLCLNAKSGQARTRAASFFYYAFLRRTSYIGETNSPTIVDRSFSFSFCAPRTHSSLAERQRKLPSRLNPLPPTISYCQGDLSIRGH